MATSGNSKNLTAALEYAKLGWPVFPVHAVSSNGTCTCPGRQRCSSPGKHPLTQHGFKDATTDHQQIRLWWTENPWANVAIAMGSASGVIALDIDPRHGGNDTLANLLSEHGQLPDTVEAQTGGGGYHYLFKPKNGHAPTCIVGPGVEIRGEGSYIVAPFSRHASGKAYRWAPQHSPLSKSPAVLPDWLEASQDPEPFPIEQNGEGTSIPQYYVEGERNKSMFKDASAMRRRGFDAEAIFQALKVQNQHKCKPPLSDYELSQIASNVERRYDPGPYGPGEAPAKPEKDSKSAKPVISLDIREILTKPYVPPNWLIPEWICRDNSCTLLAGEWGSAKSVLSLHLALNLARQGGKRTFANYLPLGGPPMRVLYIDQENPLAVVEQRLKRISAGLGISPEEYDSLSLRYLHKQSMNPDTPEGYQRLLAQIEDFQPDIMFWDSLSRLHTREENSNSEMGAYYNEIIDPLKEQYQIGIIILHNMGKGRGENGRKRPLEERVRGGSAIMDAADNGWAIDKASISERELHLIKNRQGTNPRALSLILEDSDDDTELALKAVDLASEVDDEIWGLLEDQKHAGSLRAALVKHLEIKNQLAFDTADKAVSRVLKRLTKQRKIKRKREGMAVRVWLSSYAPGDAK